MKRYIIFQIQKWEAVKIGFGLTENSLPTPKGGPEHFMPVFDRYEDALKFTGGDSAHIHECETTSTATKGKQ